MPHNNAWRLVTLRRSSKSKTGKPALQWIIDIVITESKQLLQYSNLSIKGNSDPFWTFRSFFGKYFKQYVMYHPKSTGKYGITAKYQTARMMTFLIYSNKGSHEKPLFLPLFRWNPVLFVFKETKIGVIQKTIEYSFALFRDIKLVMKRILLFLLAFLLIFPSQVTDGRKIGLVLAAADERRCTYRRSEGAGGSTGIPIDYIAGTSMGAIVGGLYSVGYNAKWNW